MSIGDLLRELRSEASNLEVKGSEAIKELVDEKREELKQEKEFKQDFKKMYYENEEY